MKRDLENETQQALHSHESWPWKGQHTRLHTDKGDGEAGKGWKMKTMRVRTSLACVKSKRVLRLLTFPTNQTFS